MSSNKELVNELLAEGRKHEHGLEELPWVRSLRPELRMLYAIAEWQHDEATSMEEALEEYGARFLDKLKDHGLAVVGTGE